jgi:hypothetical protein
MRRRDGNHTITATDVHRFLQGFKGCGNTVWLFFSRRGYGNLRGGINAVFPHAANDQYRSNGIVTDVYAKNSSAHSFYF